jgi:diaminohydroxyphosphoribosylaminopyrimidine deaminase/5-amino-6-(5-phosphoribosylamino)uracil reductase
LINRLHQKFISLAINLAKKNIGLTSPNPSIAAIIVKNSTILTTGITSINGRPHAEQIAFDNLYQKFPNIDLKDCAIYISLEPCCHYGKTSPCTDLIIKSGIKKVIFACEDIDKRVSNKSTKILEKAGIEVISGIKNLEAKNINHGFFHSKIHKKPFVTLKIATSIDGKIATKNFDSKWISNERSRKYSHYLRAKNDAILIGANSFVKDNPLLNCRIKSLEKYSPTRIILNKNFDISLSKDFLESAKNIPTFIIVRDNFDEKLNKYPNINIIKSKLDSDNQIDLEYLLPKLLKININNLLIEGGSKIINSFLKKNLIDRIIMINSNFILGNDAISAFGDLDIKYLSEIKNKFEIKKIKKYNDNIITIFQKNI